MLPCVTKAVGMFCVFLIREETGTDVGGGGVTNRMLRLKHNENAVETQRPQIKALACVLSCR